MNASRSTSVTDRIEQTDLTIIRPHTQLPFSSAVVFGGLVYVAGLVGCKPGTVELISDDLIPQCRQTFWNIDRILAEAGTSKHRILRCNVYLRHCERDFNDMNVAYAEWLGDHRPVRTTVGVTFAKPGILIEVDCIAGLPSPSK